MFFRSLIHRIQSALRFSTQPASHAPRPSRMHRVVHALIVLVCSIALSAQVQAQQNSVKILLDLKNCVNDMVKVTVYAPAMSENSSRYVMPRSVPGTYSRDDYGRFIVQAKAYNSQGTELKVTRDSGDVVIEGKVARLEYWAKDTWDDPEAVEVFQPTGTNIQKDTNYSINTHAVFGFFEGYQMLPYELQVLKPKGFYGATSLDHLELNDTTDVLTAKSYSFLVDNPVMYCIPDTVSFMQNNMNVMIAVYSQTKKVSAEMVADDLRPLSAALGRFFGVMPVTRYTFIFYFADVKKMPGSHAMNYGALEHSMSSFYFLLEGSRKGVSESVRNTAGHEFLHILVPLNLHSEEVHYFDYKQPKMSQHLWLYEGCTEYFSVLNRAQDTLMSEKEFFTELRHKIMGSQMMSKNTPFSLTEFSRNVLSPENQELYPIIYEKGAVLAFCLDQRIREVSGTKLDLLGMIRKLSENYGPDKPFKDDELFDEITRLVGDDIRPFINDYIIGKKPVPYTQFFEKVGYTYADSAEILSYTFPASRMFFKRGLTDVVVMSTHSENDFKVIDGDTLIKINDIHVTPDNKMEMLGMFVWSPRSDNEVTMTVRRSGEELQLRAKPVQKMLMKHHVLEPMAAPTAQQIAMKKAILKQS